MEAFYTNSVSNEYIDNIIQTKTVTILFFKLENIQNKLNKNLLL